MRKAVIVLPTYNEAHSVKRVIEGIFTTTDTLKNWIVQILVVDSNSPDDTATVITELQKKFNKNLFLLKTPKRRFRKGLYKRFYLRNRQTQRLYRI